jgi:group I intron endonuclease
MSSSIPPTTSGIYKIVCLPTGKVYVGSAMNLQQRWREHRTRLALGKHENAYLQNAWNKYGATAFEFVIIEEILIPFLIEREQYWIDKLCCYDRRKGYNLSPTAGSCLGMKHSEERRRNSSESHRNNFTEEMRRERSEISKRVWLTPGYRERAAQKRARHWIVTAPDGNEHAIVNLKQFCRDHGLDFGHMVNVARGIKRRQHKGWKCREAKDG